MNIAIASPPYPKTIAEGLYTVEAFSRDAASRGATIICFPESFIPGYPGLGFLPGPATNASLQDALTTVCGIAGALKIAIIIPMDWHSPKGLLNVAHVISEEGKWLGYQSKNQLDPSEDGIWVAGNERVLFEVQGMKFGITSCHEGFRYPESVRWAARAGAEIVFHPHLAGRDDKGTVPVEWGSMDNPYYEKAMMMRALENTIYFASSNYATRFPESASALIAPDGSVVAHAQYTRPGVLVATIDRSLATGHLANRYRKELYL